MQKCIHLLTLLSMLDKAYENDPQCRVFSNLCLGMFFVAVFILLVLFVSSFKGMYVAGGLNESIVA